jgi:hypothetical protein
MLYKKLIFVVVLTAVNTAHAQNLLTNGGFEIDPTPFPDITDAPEGWMWREFNGLHQQFGYIPFGNMGKHLHSVDSENWLQQTVPQTIRAGDVLIFSAKVGNINDLEDAGGMLEIANSAGDVLAASVNANTVPQAILPAGPIYYDLSVTLDVSTLTAEQQATIVGSQAMAVIHILGSDPEPYGLDSLNIYYDNAELTIMSAPTLEGDYNSNGIVDAADYVVWRDTDGSNPSGFDTWRANFGATAGSGGSLSGFGIATVPEPSCLLVLSVGIAVLSTVACRCRE